MPANNALPLEAGSVRLVQPDSNRKLTFRSRPKFRLSGNVIRRLFWLKAAYLQPAERTSQSRFYADVVPVKLQYG